MAALKDRPFLKQCAVAILLSVLAAVLTYSLTGILGGKGPLSLLVIAVTLAAYFGGGWSGLIATFVSVALVETWLQPAVFSGRHIQANVAAFTVIGVAISFLMGKLQSTNAKLAEATDQLTKINTTLSQSSEELRHSNEELQRFAYALSHDLQSTVGRIGIFTELLLKTGLGRLDGKTEKYANVIVTEVQRMRSVIDDLLAYAQAAHNEFPRENVDCNAVIKTVLEDLASQTRECGAAITVDKLPEVYANPAALREVFFNLVGNAIKYRGDESLTIYIAARLAENEWLIAVRDNGIGIDMHYADKIFGVFERLHTASKYEGSGIGLALCQSIIRRHGGRIWVESAPGKGSTFTFAIPKHKTASR